jgi:hypothetical protein
VPPIAPIRLGKQPVDPVGRQAGSELLTSNIIKPEPSDVETGSRWDFAAIQQRQIALFKQHHPRRRRRGSRKASS